MDSFDYVVVGAGSAGCVLANRLSADPKNRVCLIEAGPTDTSPFIHVPLGILPLMRHKVLNWRFQTVPQAAAANRQIYVPRGKTLGGSSSINTMVYTRGHRNDYDEWAAAGNAGWSYREVLPYFLRSENNATFGAPYHSQGGLMKVTDSEGYSPLVEIMCDAARSLQWPINTDFNGSSQDGFGKRQVTISKGRRVSTSTAFLKPALERTNLTVITGALVDKVVTTDRRATGIVLNEANGKRQLSANREIILAAGAIGSPTILLRSGIGDANEVRSFGIDLVHQLPAVGANLQEHPLVTILHKTASTLPYGVSPTTVPWLIWQLAKYAIFRKGLLANNVFHACGNLRTDPALDRPDLLLILMPAGRTSENPAALGHGYGLAVVPLRPSSRGKVGLTGAQADAEPMIDLRLLSDDSDVELMLRGIKLARQMLAAPAWDRVRGPEVSPGPKVDDDGTLIDYIRRTCATAFHPVGTCTMGTDPSNSVVDPELKVHGIAGLRVADASIMPRIIGGNTNAPAIMIGEKASDMVLGKTPLAAIDIK